MTALKEIYQQVKSALADYGVVADALEAKRLVFSVLDESEELLITNPDYELSYDQLKRINDMLAERLEGKPLTKIVEQTEFWGLPFTVTEDTLDPRPDTEILVEAVLEYARTLEKDDLRIVDLGTGTGCILIALLSELPQARGLAIDKSKKALAITEKNAALNQVSARLTTQKGDWLEGIDLKNVDLIVSNPPYIRDEVIPDLQPEVKNHDPILALSGGKNGIDAYEKIFSSLKKAKEGTGRIFLEIGFDQEKEVLRLVDDSNLCHIDSKRDLGGNVRVVEIAYGDK